MKSVSLWFVSLFLLVGCGASETAATAAAEAKMKAQEIEQGKQLEARMKAQTDQALAAGQAKLQAAEQKAESGAVP